MRGVAVALHRTLGLTLAGFLIIIGLTGSVIVFFGELDEWANPGLLKVQPGNDYVDFLALRENLQAQDPKAHVYGVVFPENTDDAVTFFAQGAIDATSGEYLDPGYDEVFADPYTGRRLGHRLWGDFSFDSKDLTTFVYFLHYSLVLPEEFGELVMGIVALVFAADCIVALYLTLPRRQPREAQRGKTFLRRWKRSWQIERGGSPFRIVFDWHRASGLWIWPMLLIFAVSGFAFNMPRTYLAVMNKVTNYVDTHALPVLDRPVLHPAVDWDTALSLGKTYMEKQAHKYDFTIERPSSLIFRRETGIYDYRVQSSRDLAEVPNYGYTSVAIDAMTGKLHTVELPTGLYAANTFTAWIKALHQARVFGLPYRLFCSALGLMLAALTITGVVIWYRRRTARLRRPSSQTNLSPET